MRLTLVISTLGRGGAERVMSILASAWAAQGHEVTLITLDDDQPPSYPLHPAVVLTRLGLHGMSTSIFQGLSRNLARIRSLGRVIRASNPDVVISFMDSTNILAILATRGLRRPLIISERIDPALYTIGWPWDKLRRLLYRFADRLVCPTEATVDRFRHISRVTGVAIQNPLDVPPDRRSDKNAQMAPVILLSEWAGWSHKKGSTCSWRLSQKLPAITQSGTWQSMVRARFSAT